MEAARGSDPVDPRSYPPHPSTVGLKVGSLAQQQWHRLEA